LVQAELDRREESGAGPILELAWRLASEHETHEELSFKCGRIAIWYYLDARIERLEIQKARSAHKDAGSTTGPYVDVLAQNLFDQGQQVARAGDEAARTPPAELDRERLRAARQILRELEDELLAGRRSPDTSFLGPIQQLLRAELAVRGEDDTAAALELGWRHVFLVETIARRSFNTVFPIAPAEYQKLRGSRLEHQLALARLDPAKRLGAPFATAELLAGQDDPLDRLKELARGRFEAEEMTPEEVVRAWREAARKVHQAHFDEVQCGRMTPDTLLPSFAQLSRAEQARRGEEGRAAILEASWRLAWQVDQISQADYRRGRIGFGETLETTYHRLAAEMELARLRERKPEK
jgi:hypothetical protein